MQIFMNTLFIFFSFVLGKIEITFEKVEQELWSNFGIFERTRTKDETVYNEFKIAAKNFLNDDSFELILRPNKKQIIVVPIGFHLNFRLSILGRNILSIVLYLHNEILTSFQACT